MEILSILLVRKCMKSNCGKIYNRPKILKMLLKNLFVKNAKKNLNLMQKIEFFVHINVHL